MVTGGSEKRPAQGGMLAGGGGRWHTWAQVIVSEALPNSGQWLQETPTGPRAWLSIPWLWAGAWTKGLAG